PGLGRRTEQLPSGRLPAHDPILVAHRRAPPVRGRCPPGRLTKRGPPPVAGETSRSTLVPTPPPGQYSVHRFIVDRLRNAGRRLRAMDETRYLALMRNKSATEAPTDDLRSRNLRSVQLLALDMLGRPVGS